VSAVRVLVGTKKGAFLLSSDGKARQVDVDGPHFAGWEVYSRQGIAVDPTGSTFRNPAVWFGGSKSRFQRRRQVLGADREHLHYDGIPGTHQWYDGHAPSLGIQKGLASRTLLDHSDTVFAGVEDAALSARRRGMTWNELSGLREHGSGRGGSRAPGNCLHTILVDPKNPARIFIAISSAGAFRTDDGGTTWQPINQGLRSEHIPDPNADVGHCVHRIADAPLASGMFSSCKKHWRSCAATTPAIPA